MFHGSLVALITPMNASGAVDYATLKNLLDWHIQQGTDGLVITGSTGEAASLTDDEREQIIKTTVDYVNGRMPVIVGTGAQSTWKTIELSRQAMALGADACLVVAPAYVRPTQEGMYQHYKALAQAVPLPIIMYNVPSRTACDLMPETVCRLASISNIVGIKDATGRLERLREMQELCGNRLDYFSGDDPSALDFMLQGGKGVISITSNVAPLLMQQMCKAALKKDIAHAQELNERLSELHTLLCIESNPIPVKWVLNKMGKIAEGIRLPLLPLSEHYQPKVLEACRSVGLVG